MTFLAILSSKGSVGGIQKRVTLLDKTKQILRDDIDAAVQSRATTILELTKDIDTLKGISI